MSIGITKDSRFTLADKGKVLFSLADIPQKEWHQWVDDNLLELAQHFGYVYDREELVSYFQGSENSGTYYIESDDEYWEYLGHYHLIETFPFLQRGLCDEGVFFVISPQLEIIVWDSQFYSRG